MKVIPSSILLCLACFSFANFSSAQSFSISSEAVIECDSDTQSITILQDETRLLTIESIKFDYTEAESIEIVGLTDDDSLQIRLQFPSSVHFWHHANDIEPRFADLRIQAVSGGIRLSAEPEWAEHITLVLKDTGDHQFGLCEPLQPDNQLSPDLRGKIIDLKVRSDGQTFVENYASAFSSLYMSSEGYGAFFDTFARGRYSLRLLQDNT